MVTFPACALLCLLSSAQDAVLLEFTADWCGACRAVEPTVQRMVADGYPVQRIQVDQQPQSAARFRVTAVPCFVLTIGGQEVDRVEGPASYARLAQMFEQAGARSTAAMETASAPPPPTVRGQSPRSSSGFGLPRPFANIAKGLSGRESEAREPNLGARSSQPADPRASDPRVPEVRPAPRSMTDVSVPSQSAASPATDPRLVQQAMRATVRIRVQEGSGQSLGTGTIVDMHGDEALVVTCGHIFRESNGKGRIAVDLFTQPQPRTVNGTLISFDLDRDIGLIAITPGMTIAPVRVAPPAFQVSRGQAVFSVGCDKGGDPSVKASSITAIDRYVGPPNLEVAGMPVDGRSGGGLFSVDGLLIGICNAADPEDKEGIYASLPIIHWELDKIGQRAVYDPRGAAIAVVPPRPSNAVPPAFATAETSARGLLTQDIPRAGKAIDATVGVATADDTEVICIVRSRANPQGSERLLVLERPSREFLDRLTDESQRRPIEVAQNPISRIPAGPGPQDRPVRIDPNTGRSQIIRAQSTER